jgi:thiol-disulfide isomerase/thioredoxin
MNNIWLLGVVLLIASAAGFWLKTVQGRIRKAKFHQNYADEFSDFGSLGQRATLIQFSTQFCSTCPATKKILNQIASDDLTIEFIEIDAEQNIELAKKLSILSTPTILITDHSGEELARITGKPSKKVIEGYLNSISSPNFERKTA